MEPKEIYRSIKGRCSKDREFGNSAGAMINLVWEDRIDMKKNMPVSRHTIKPILTMLFIQTLTRKNNIPYVYHKRSHDKYLLPRRFEPSQDIVIDKISFCDSDFTKNARWKDRRPS